MTETDSWASARDEPPFSNGTEGYGWMGAWCDRCLVDAPFRNGISPTGCELLLIAMVGKTPAEWLEQPLDEQGRYSIEDQYHCINFRAPGDGGGREPRPKPTPRGQGELFAREQVRGTRMLSQPSVVEAVDQVPQPTSLSVDRAGLDLHPGRDPRVNGERGDEPRLLVLDPQVRQ